MRRVLMGLMVTALVVAAACREGSIVNPPPGPGCGWDVDCGNGACCPYMHICGGPNAAGFQRCEPGYCCFDGDPLFGAGPDAGIGRTHKVKAREAK